jgi:probable H4MPT-linked C1 transfer pathway protein
MTITAGLDVGGAHLKVALARNGIPVEVRQIACPLWQGMDRLDAALAEATPLLRQAHQHAVTMTGELSDLFDDRQSGVHALVDRLVRELGPDTLFWAGRRGLVGADDARAHVGDVASTNFLATATLASSRVGRGLLIDMGSTTTDIIAMAKGMPVVRGGTDAERLESGELVYSGLTRTAVMAVADRVPFDGRWQTLAREYFATMADVRRIIGDLPEGVDQHATADGRGKSLEESEARLARMLGRDRADGEAADWRMAARFVAEVQVRSIVDGCYQVLSGHPEFTGMAVVAAGIGSGVVSSVADRLAIPCLSFGELTGASGDAAVWATRCAAAAAVAILSGPLLALTSQ